MKAIIVAIGDELTSGQIIDTNSAYLSRRLAELGIETVAHRTVADDREGIASGIARASKSAGLVLVTGGLGPTADDVTRQALADAMKTELVLDERSLAQIEEFFHRRGRTMVPANRAQAMIPRGAEPLENRVGTAPGITVKLAGADVFLLPGVPQEMRWMFENVVALRLPRGERCIVHHLIHTFGTGESNIGAQISDLMVRSGETTVGTTAAGGVVSIRITSRARTLERTEHEIQQLTAEIRRRLGDLVVSEGETTMPAAVGDLLRSRGETLATAESCTGGLIGEMITSVPGSSDYYLGGVVAYANQIKQSALDVPEELLTSHGAVSEPVVRAMAEGVRKKFTSDWGISVTGIAGPTGGSEEKPVGLVYIALVGPDVSQVHRHVFPGDRNTIRLRSALTALNYLRLALAK